LASKPNATVSQVSARASIANTPAATIHSTGPAVGRKPSSTATPTTAAAVIRLRIMLPATWPVSTDEREIAMVRNRAKIPSLAAEQGVDRALGNVQVDAVEDDVITEGLAQSGGHDGRSGGGGGQVRVHGLMLQP
jgi:hypothetical protein